MRYDVRWLPLALFLPLLPAALSAQGTIRGRLADSAGAPVPQAVVTLEETTLRATSNDQGEYVIARVPAGTWTIRVHRIGYAAPQATVRVRNGESTTRNFTLQPVAATLALQVITGSRAQHTAADELPVPVDVFPMKRVREQGTMETAQILSQLAPSINFQRQSVSDATEIVRPFTMRGLSPDHTLVLVNGKRQHHTALVHYFGAGMPAGSSGVDLNALPASVVERLEVLRDGAASQYGSDAIAGVVNMVTKSGAFPLTIGATTGRYYPGDFDAD
ncbi:MAG TPA: TonB-dependent receptor, partial [Gemmatimonadaceae bacterium]|nr:TonB-dependent receptor [Gemmatimonadaceae bacterium]